MLVKKKAENSGSTVTSQSLYETVKKREAEALKAKTNDAMAGAATPADAVKSAVTSQASGLSLVGGYSNSDSSEDDS